MREIRNNNKNGQVVVVLMVKARSYMRICMHVWLYVYDAFNGS